MTLSNIDNSIIARYPNTGSASAYSLNLNISQAFTRSMFDKISSDLRDQWINPGDILSLLLLIGGDIVQKAIAQLVGYTIRPFGKNSPKIGIAPVAFSFGWVAYGFSNLISAVGERRLMPTADCPCQVVNCASGFSRTNVSWALGRLLRDHEIRHEVDRTNPTDQQRSAKSSERLAESLRIDIFELEEPSKPSLDMVWWLGWVTIAAQISIAVVPWALFRNWGVMMVVLCGNFLALLTCALPQWREEKWAGGDFQNSENVTCLTRGNGHLHIMVFIGHKGSPNLEVLATAVSNPRPETPLISLVLAVLWTCLLISVSGLKEHAWFLVGIGGIGMLQNVYAAGKTRDPASANFHLKKFRMPTIIAKRQYKKDETTDADVDLDKALADVAPLSEWEKGKIEMPKWLESMEVRDGLPTWLKTLKGEENEIANVIGALIELEKWVPTAGLAMLQVFFPGSLGYNDASMRDNSHKRFWKRAYHTKDVRRRAERKRSEVERSRIEV
ncbi:hypothetical protein BP5796_07702 [Coleophoma crateriformis]|uniref:Uncharacterized protein n=1 Tax=Coleophoma crateriformis TaxID=565419 RepID=A0A3D8RCM3_9HELO|nr:hypothetical protein BP5796_07702 [Coleophoma crateriformis]